MALASRLKVVDQDVLNQIHSGSLDILEKTGVVFDSEEARNIFKSHGAKVSGHVVFIPGEMVEKCIALCPQSFTLWARNESNNLLIGGNQEQVVISPSNGPIFVQSIEHGRRRAQLNDFINFVRLSHASQTVDLITGLIVDPVDVEAKGKYLRLLYEMLKHSDKPFMSIAVTQAEAHQLFEMIEIAFGQEGFLKDHPVVAYSVNPLSPLRYEELSCETILAYAKHGQPLFILSCAMAGISAPINLLGTTLLTNAEILAGIALIQLIHPGSPVVYCPASTVADMRKGSYITGSPEANLINIAGLQMALDLYGIPCRSMAGLTDAKTVDCQAGYETMQNLMMLMLSGVHIVVEALGVLESIMTTSYEKWILDEEMIQRVVCIAKGLDESDKALSVDIIREVGHSGSYLMHPSTLAHMRKRWEPTISDWSSFVEWEGSDRKDIVAKANHKVKRILESSEGSMMDPEMDKELVSFMNGVIEGGIGY